jgi:hypothetical protein
MYRAGFVAAVMLCAIEVASAQTKQPSVIARLQAAYETCVNRAVADRIDFALREASVVQVVERAFGDCVTEEDALVGAHANLFMLPTVALPNKALIDARVTVDRLKLRIKTDWVTHKHNRPPIAAQPQHGP